MRDLAHKIHLHLWYKLHMIEAYLAFHRGEMLLCAEYENMANRCESELQRMRILK